MSRAIEIKVFDSYHKGFERFRFAPVVPDMEYSKAGIDAVIAMLVAELTKQYPNNTFKVIPIGQREFNILPEKCGDA